MLTRAELEYLVRVPNELRQINETLKEISKTLEIATITIGTIMIEQVKNNNKNKDNKHVEH